MLVRSGSVSVVVPPQLALQSGLMYDHREEVKPGCHVYVCECVYEGVHACVHEWYSCM